MSELAVIPEDIKAEIHRRLRRVEEEESVRIILAIESGSRAWGFASPNSDYDVRFIYVRPKEWYLRVDLEEQRDVIEYPIVDDIDLNGWDVRKALRLFGKSNPAFIEWIQSPITYIENGDFRKNALAALPSVYSVEKGLYHYRSMAKTNYRGYLQDTEVPLKKYFYALRPLLAARWIERTQLAAPIEFERVLGEIANEDKLLREIRALLVKKMASEEIAKGARIDVINRFISTELDRLEKHKAPKMVMLEKRGILNDIFTLVLNES